MIRIHSEMRGPYMGASTWSPEPSAELLPSALRVERKEEGRADQVTMGSFHSGNGS